jgi:uncharacterized protein YaaW (UPF0174 family)
MKIEFDVLERNDLLRACRLVNEDGWTTSLEDKSNDELQKKIYDKLNPNGNRVRAQYRETMKTFDLNYHHSMSDDEIKENLYENNCEMIRERIEEMSEDEKKDLAEQIEEEIDNDKLEKLKKATEITNKVGGVAGGARAGGAGVLALQGGAVAITGSNLGVCVLLTSGLSSISSAIGVAFPFAAYTGAAAVGGQILAVAGALSNPIFWVPAVAAAGGAGYHAYKKSQERQYAYLAGVNYLIESKKRLQQAG